MYFPYLYARRFELLALRDLVSELVIEQTIIPILEPITLKPADLIRCLKMLDEKKTRTILIVNPKQGDFKHQMVAEWWQAVAPEIESLKHVVIGIACDAKMPFSEVKINLKYFKGKDFAILYSGPKFSDTDILSLAENAAVKFHVVIQDRISDAQRKLIPKKKLVDVKDHFNAMDKNAEYGGSELFSDKHLTFTKHGVGFGDYSVIGSKYRKGGGEPAAVVIHALYKEGPSGHLHVEHFLSDDVEQGVGSVGKKFLQAVAKLNAQVKKRKSEFGSNSALAAYADDQTSQHYPGLGENKRRQILHHLALVHTLLQI